MPATDEKKTILICSANPKDMPHDRLADEQRLIASTLQSDKQREKYKIVYSTATTTRSLSQAILTHEPSILHFCGKADCSGLYVEDENGHAKVIDPHDLLNLLDLFRDSLELVFLSGCYHPQLMENIKTQISDVVGILPHPDLSRKDLEGLVAPFYAATFDGRGAVWAADYARKAQKLDIEKRHLAALLVHHSEEIPKNIEVPVLHMAKPEPAKVEYHSWVESLLPFLCDCTDMEMAFRKALRHYLHEPIRGPLVVFFLGDENDCLHKLLERFHYHPLKRISGAYKQYSNWDFRSAGSEWPTSLNSFNSELSIRLAHALDLFAVDEDELIADWPTRMLPQVMPVRYDLNSWKGNRGEGLQAFCDFWTPFLGSNFGQPLVIFFQIEFKQPKNFWQKNSQTELKRVRDFIAALQKNGSADLNLVLLPSTDKIRSGHVQSWKEHELMQAFLGDKRFHLDISEILASIEDCNNMKRTAQKLKKVLSDLNEKYKKSA